MNEIFAKRKNIRLFIIFVITPNKFSVHHFTGECRNVTLCVTNRNRIGQNFGKDNESLVCRTKLLNQLGVTIPIESLHNLIETLKYASPE